MTLERGHAQMQYDAPLTQAQGQAILQRLDQILAQLNLLAAPYAYVVDGKKSARATAAPDVVPEKTNLPTAPEKVGFDLFWSVYPRKIGKGAAELAWKKLKPDATLQRRIIEAVKAQCKSEQWRRDGGQFIPHPATWLNGKRWEDEVEVKIAQDKPPVFYKTLPERPAGEAPPPEVQAALSKLLGRDMSF
ncbi:MAG: hypothetical protein ABT940_00500 [Alphaproteobacteria bacterium]